MAANNPESQQDGSGAPQTEAALVWLRRAGAERELLTEVAGEVKRARKCRVRAVAASLALALGGFVAWSVHVEQSLQPATQPTPLAQANSGGTATIMAPRLEILPDGSTVELKEGAVFRHEFSGALRAVTLLRGEAHFDVVKDPARPFVVSAGTVSVRAVGTAFMVDVAAASVEVVVTEGTVAVDKTSDEPASQRAGAPTLLQVGGRAVIRVAERPVDPEVTVLEAAELAKRLAWRVPPEATGSAIGHGSGVRQRVDGWRPGERRARRVYRVGGRAAAARGDRAGAGPRRKIGCAYGHARRGRSARPFTFTCAGKKRPKPAPRRRERRRGRRSDEGGRGARVAGVPRRYLEGPRLSRGQCDDRHAAQHVDQTDPDANRSGDARVHR